MTLVKGTARSGLGGGNEKKNHSGKKTHSRPHSRPGYEERLTVTLRGWGGSVSDSEGGGGNFTLGRSKRRVETNGLIICWVCRMRLTVSPERD